MRNIENNVFALCGLEKKKKELLSIILIYIISSVPKIKHPLYI